MASISSSHLRGSALYFFLYMALGSVSPFIPLIWRSKGISDHQIGVLGAIRPVCSFFAAPVICAFADRHSIQQQVFYATMILFAIIRPSLLLAGSFLAIGVVEAMNAIVMSPIGSLVDSAIIHFSGGGGYGTQRVWGAIGFGASSLLGGYVSDAAWGGYAGIMIVFVMTMTVASCATVGIPMKRSEVEEGSRTEKQNRLSYRECLSDAMDGGTSGGEVEFGDLFTVAEEASRMNFETTISPSAERRKPNEGLEKGRIVHAVDEEEEQESNRCHEERRVLPSVLSLLLSSSQNLSFFIAVTLSGMGSGVIDTFLFIRLEELGGSHLLCGVARLIMCLAEVPVFYLSGAMIRCMGVQGVIALAQTAYLIRFMYYSVLENPWWVLPAEVLHGLTFAAMWAASTNYAHVISPAWLQTTIQGVISGLHWGLGTGLGAVMGGVLYASLGARLCFRISSVLPTTSILLVAFPTIWRWRKTRKNQQSDEGAAFELVSKKHLDDAGDDRLETPHDGDDDNHCVPIGDISDKHTSRGTESDNFSSRAGGGSVMVGSEGLEFTNVF